jgi:cytochrome c-type biogenesis protein CcmH/NrfF
MGFVVQAFQNMILLKMAQSLRRHLFWEIPVNLTMLGAGLNKSDLKLSFQFQSFGVSVSELLRET